MNVSTIWSIENDWFEVLQQITTMVSVYDSICAFGLQLYGPFLCLLLTPQTSCYPASVMYRYKSPDLVAGSMMVADESDNQGKKLIFSVERHSLNTQVASMECVNIQQHSSMSLFVIVEKQLNANNYIQIIYCSILHCCTHEGQFSSSLTDNKGYCKFLIRKQSLQ